MLKGKYIRTEEIKEKYRLAKKGYIPCNKGKKSSLETRQKLSKAKIGHIPWNKGKKCPQLSRVKSQCEIEKLRFANSGEKGSNWKGGITKEVKKIRASLEYKLWVNANFARDGYTCQKYDIKGGKLVVHHIENFSSHPELRFAIDNGITLSKKAHDEFHKIYGTKNNSREQLIEFLNN